MDTLSDPKLGNVGERLRAVARMDPHRFPRLGLIAARWAEAATAKLNATYASPVRVEFTALSSFAFSVAALEASETQLALTVRSPKFRETVLVTTDARFADTVSEAAFGGDGRDRIEANRALTSVSKFFADNAMRAFVETGNAAFADILPLMMTTDRLVAENVGAVLDAMLPEEARNFVEFRFRVAIGRCEAALRIAIPEAVLAPHKRVFSVVPDEAPSIVDEGWARDLEAGFQKADMKVSAILAEQPMTLGALATLQIGQTIALDATMESLVLIECEGQRLFRGHMGRSRDSYMIRIEENVDPTEEFIDDILAD